MSEQGIGYTEPRGESLGWWGALAIGFVLVIALLTWVDWAHGRGYAVGFETARTYFEATGEWPSDEWIDDQHPLRAKTPEDIQRTLSPYSLEK